MLENNPNNLNSRFEPKVSAPDVSSKNFTDNQTGYGSRKVSGLHSKSSTKISAIQYLNKDKTSSRRLISSKQTELSVGLSSRDKPDSLFCATSNMAEFQISHPIADRLQINYLEDQRLSFLADSQACVDIKSSNCNRSHVSALEERDTNRNYWHRRATTDGDYGILSRLDSTSKLESKVNQKLKENRQSFGDHCSQLVKLSGTSTRKEFWSPVNLNLELTGDSAPLKLLAEFKDEYKSPQDEKNKSVGKQATLGSDIVRQEESSHSQNSTKLGHGAYLKQINTPVKNFDYEGRSDNIIEKTDIFKGLHHSSKSDKLKKKTTSDIYMSLLAVGGSSEKEHMTIEAFDLESNSWRSVFKSKMPLECRTKFGAIMINKRDILVFGGKTSSRRFKNSMLIEVGKAQMKETTFSLSEPKSGFGYCVHNSKPS